MKVLIKMSMLHKVEKVSQGLILSTVSVINVKKYAFYKNPIL